LQGDELKKFVIAVVIVAASTLVLAEPAGLITFENFSPGSVDGQYGWRSRGSVGRGCAVYDHMVVFNSGAPASFGLKSLRISNAVTSGCFSDQTFAPSLANVAAEPTAYDDLTLGPTGNRQPAFFGVWNFASANPTVHQQDLRVVVSPDNGQGARMSWIGMFDQPAGLEVGVYEYVDKFPYGSPANPGAGVGPEDDFIYHVVAAGLDRTKKHEIAVAISLRNGPRNDVVGVVVDRQYQKVVTSWEDYYRWAQGPGDPEQTAPVRESRVVRTLMFRTGGAAAGNTLGQGFLFDNVSYGSVGGLP
jgi:hypothetical protein